MNECQTFFWGYTLNVQLTSLGEVASVRKPIWFQSQDITSSRPSQHNLKVQVFIPLLGRVRQWPSFSKSSNASFQLHRQDSQNRRKLETFGAASFWQIGWKPKTNRFGPKTEEQTQPVGVSCTARCSSQQIGPISLKGASFSDRSGNICDVFF